MLGASDILAYVMSRGLIGSEAVLDGDLQIVDASRRHCNFKVLSCAGPSYFVKQNPNADGPGTVAYEAAAYSLLTSRVPANESDLLLPRCYAYDAGRSVLVLDLDPGAETLREHHLRRKRFPPEPAVLAGRALACVHGLFTPEALGSSEFSGLSRQPPPIRLMYCPPPRLLHSFSGANLALMQKIQQVPRLYGLLEELAETWSAETLVHGDLRWDNCLILRPLGGRRQLSLQLIDWEYAGVGDPAWDIGTFLGEYIGYWILCIPPTAEGSAFELAAQSTSPIERMRPALRAFWRTYTQSASLAGAAAEQRLVRAVRYMGVHLVQTATEHLYTASDVSRAAVHLVQLGMNALERPRDAASRLLGITLERPVSDE